MTHAIAIQVYMLDKRMLDPRRPKGPPTAEDQLEQLIPYQQNLVMSPLLYASHSKQVAQLSGDAHHAACRPGEPKTCPLVTLLTKSIRAS